MDDYGVLTKRRVAVWMGAALVIVVGLSLIVGCLAAREHETIDWELAGIIGTALGTTALAGFTGALAFTTSGDVRATWELARIQREEQDERDLPNLVLHSAGFTGVPREGTIHVHLINAGRGPAFGIQMDVAYGEHVVQVIGGGRWSAIGPGGDAQFAIQVRVPDPPAGGLTGRFEVTGVYRDRWLAREYEILTAFRTV